MKGNGIIYFEYRYEVASIVNLLMENTNRKCFIIYRTKVKTKHETKNLIGRSENKSTMQSPPTEDEVRTGVPSIRQEFSSTEVTIFVFIKQGSQPWL